MNAKLKLLERSVLRRHQLEEPPPETSHGLGAAIESLIADEVARRVGEAVDRKPPPRVRELFRAPDPVTDYRAPPVPRTAPAKNRDLRVYRDAAGKIQWAEVSGVKFKVLRDGAGNLLGMREVDESPLPTMPESPLTPPMW